MSLHLRTKNGCVASTLAAVEKLRREGKLREEMRCISIDGGQTWICYSELQGAMAGQRQPLQPVSAGPGGAASTQSSPGGKSSDVYVKLSCPFWYFLYRFSTPRVVIDGVEHRRNWGRHYFPLAPGPHKIDIFFPYRLALMSRCGFNYVSFDLRPGEVVEIDYGPPMPAFLKGNIAIRSNLGQPVLISRYSMAANLARVFKGNPAAFWSMVLGIISIPLFVVPPTAIAAVVLGHIGLSATKRADARPGRGFAIAGLATAYAALGLFALIILVAIVSAISQ